MKFLKAIMLTMVSFGLVTSSMPAMADEASDLRSEIQELKSRLSQLESKLAQAPSTSASVSTGSTPTLAVPSMVEGIELSGYVDTTYQNNFNSQNSGINTARVFDTKANSFQLNAVELDLKKAVSAENRVGFRTDLVFGNDAEVIGSVTSGLGSTTDEFDLQQAYVEILAPTSNIGLNDLDIKVGKFVTLVGAEVIESKDNWNSSRSFLFGYAEPATHTGILGNYPFTAFDQSMHVAFGVVNGWDIVDDNNNGKSIMWQYGLDGIALPSESKLTVALTGVWGPERGAGTSSFGAVTASDSDARNLTNLVMIYNTPWKPLTLMYSYDYGHEDNVLSIRQPNDNDGNWDGHAVYGRFDINSNWSFSSRWEYFNDDDGIRIVAGTPADYWEITATLEYRPWEHIITRLEYRHDDADRNVFADGNASGLDDSQNTILGEVMFAF